MNQIKINKIFKKVMDPIEEKNENQNLFDEIINVIKNPGENEKEQQLAANFLKLFHIVKELETIPDNSRNKVSCYIRLLNYFESNI